jgi:2-C-methyl-D-erythritol 2,4-cyclodiphosphate synthase/2-C-methyl-D-erythritol 4-phosphate cytidylyltransferase
VPDDLVTEAEAVARDAGPAKIAAVTAGGPHRQQSVLNGLRCLAADPPDVVAVHDGARPLATPDLVCRCVESAIARGSGVAAVPVTDTLKRATEGGRVEGTVDRASLWAMQTPQVFGYAALVRAHEQALGEGCQVTDDAAVIEALGEPVWLVQGEETNIKVTTPEDLALAADILARRSERPGDTRIGHGFDAHRMAAGRPCILGGVDIAHDSGPVGHSDGDVLTHAIMDAVLGALALGDIGRHFPDSDPAYEGARSLELAAEVARLAREAGYCVGNIDATVVAQAPRISSHVPAMRDNVAAAFGCDPSLVSIKGTTTEGMGFTGTGEGIAAHAVVLLHIHGS